MQITQQISDAALVQAYQRGDNRALETLINRHKDKIFTAIFMLVRDRYIAEDIFQETFLKLIRNIRSAKYAERGKFLPWAVRVAHNLCMDHFRKVRQQIPVVTHDGQDVFASLLIEKEQPGSRLEIRQTHDSVRQLIEQLPEDQRVVVALRIYGDLSFKQIAEVTGTNVNTALGRMRYALINLRKMIRQQQLVLR